MWVGVQLGVSACTVCACERACECVDTCEMSERVWYWAGTYVTVSAGRPE